MSWCEGCGTLGRHASWCPCGQIVTPLDIEREKNNWMERARRAEGYVDDLKNDIAVLEDRLRCVVELFEDAMRFNGEQKNKTNYVYIKRDKFERAFKILRDDYEYPPQAVS